METGVIKHGVDLGGLLGFSCPGLQVSLVQAGYSSPPGCIGVRLDQHQVAHDRFHWQNYSTHGEVHVAVAELQPVEAMSCSSAINWVGQICWALRLAGEKTESSS